VSFMLVAIVVITAFAGCRRDADMAALEEIMVTAVPTGPSGGGGGGREATPTPEATRILDTPTPTPTRAPPASTEIFYTVRAGDTLLRVAMLYGTTVESLMALNGLTNADQISVGQRLQVAMEAQYTGPGEVLMPDSEMVYGPGYLDFDVAADVARHPGLLASYTEEVNGRTMSGAEIVELVAVQYSVGPRVLLTMLEYRGHWLSNPEPTEAQQRYPLGYNRGLYWEGLYFQLSQAANGLNAGFYGWWGDSLWLIQTGDGAFIQYSTDINAATAGVQKVLADTAPDYETWLDDLEGFRGLYHQLFGDPFDYAVEPLMPAHRDMPDLLLPWAEGETWYFTGGPHHGWGSQGALSAIDFATDERHIGCATSQRWVTAATAGHVLMSEDGMVLQELDNDGYVGSGWILLYMHIAALDRVEAGADLRAGDRIGHPSCEGGVSNATHLHLARRLNGVWVATDDERWPMALSGWISRPGNSPYEGTLERGGEILTACECWDAINAVTR
jgi:LysM repeat protein